MKKLVPKHPRAAEFVARDLYNVSSFKELESKIAALESKDERGAAFEVFAEAFFVTQQGIDPNYYWPQGKVPFLLQEELGLPRKDFGIDSVYLNDVQQYDACQCKFRDGRPTLTWDDLATFSALASSGKFQNKVLFTNCENVVPILQQDPYSVILIRGSRLDQLTPDQLRAINDWLNQRPPSVKYHDARRDQLKAVEAINAELKIADRAQSIQYCGTGKTLTALWLKESRNPDTTLVLVPSLALLSQIRSDWMEQRKQVFRSLYVCSDPQVAPQEDENNDGSDPSDYDFRVSTSPDEVRRFLDLETSLPKVVFCTYQSTHVLRNAGRHEWDLGIFDEAHKTAGREGRAFSAALDNDNVPIKKRVFFTATPKHSNPLRKNEEGDPEVIFSMDREAQYGRVAYELSCRKAVELGIICDYKVLITVFTTAEVNDWLLKHGEVPVKPVSEGGDFVKAWDVANQLAITKAYSEYGIKKTFTFHSRVSAARSFVSDGVEGIGTHLKDVECRSVDGSMNMGERRAIMEIIKDSPRALLSNAKCLTEGVNLPSVDGVAFLSPKRSRIDIAQAMGRGMRKNGGSKKTGYVIVPVYIALAEDESQEEAIQRAKFDTVLEVLQTLKEVDEAFADYLKELVQPKKRTKGSSDWRLTEHLKIDVPPLVLLEQLANAIELKCLNYLIPSWDQRYAELVAFKEANGHCNVPGDHFLSRWCIHQRRCRKQKIITLTPERITRLDAIGFDWDPITNAWEKSYAELVAYKEANGHCDVPQSSGPLGVWCTVQRNRRKDRQIPPEQIARLDAIGFSWEPLDDRWDKNYADLVAFKETHGHLRVGNSDALGAWCCTQRIGYKQGKMSLERIAKLEAINFPWDIHQESWDKNYADLVAFKEVHGHCNVPTVSLLGKWCHAQRGIKATLSPGRIARLDALGFPWDAREARWENMFAELVAFKEANGHCDVPAGSPLGAWCGTQRTVYGKGKMTPERIARLNAIGFCWDPIDAVWEKRYAELMAFKEANGHCRVPSNVRPLGTWCNHQRRFYKKEKLSQERIARLNAIGFDLGNYLVGVWEERYAELAAYKKMHGHCNVPFEKGTSRLGRWVQIQRRFAKQGKLSQERIDRLNALGFCWDSDEAFWNERYAELVAFKKLNGHCNVSGRDGVLGKWCANTRHSYKAGLLSPEKTAQLDAIGFGRGLRDDRWETMYAELVAYKKANGHCNVPHGNNPTPLGSWVAAQRQKRRNNKLSQERIAKLDALGFRW